MALIASLFAVIGRFLGRVLTMALGWASILLFGRVPESKQLLLAIVSFGSLAWVIAILGSLIPDLGSFLLTAAPVPAFIAEGWVRLAMLVAALVLPLLIGVGGLLLMDARDRPSGKGLIVQILRGYPYAAVLAVTLAFMALVAPVRKARSLARRWEDAHIPVVVKPGGYERVAMDLERALDDAGLAVSRTSAPRVLEAPSKLLGAVAGRGFGSLVPDRLVVLAGRGIEVLVYPSDVSISGRRQELARARAAIASRLTFTQAYLTSNRESQAIEDRLERVGRMAGADGAGPVAAAEVELAAIDDELASLAVDYEEWEVLYRLRLQVERNLVTGRGPRAARAAGTPQQAGAGLSTDRGGLVGDTVSAAVMGLAAAAVNALFRRTPLARLEPGAETAERERRSREKTASQL